MLWVKPGYGCRSTPIVMNGRVYFIGRAGSGVEEGERLVCLNADSGEVIWEDFMNVFHSDIVSNRLGWTSPVGDPETGHVYIHGTQGFFRCYDKDGKIVWQHNLSEEYGRVTGYGGRIVGPTLEGDLVIAAMISGSWGDFARGEGVAPTGSSSSARCSRSAPTCRRPGSGCRRGGAASRG